MDPMARHGRDQSPGWPVGMSLGVCDWGHISSFLIVARLSNARSAWLPLNRLSYRWSALAAALYPANPVPWANSLSVSPHSRRPKYNTRSRPVSPYRSRNLSQSSPLACSTRAITWARLARLVPKTRNLLSAQERDRIGVCPRAPRGLEKSLQRGNPPNRRVPNRWLAAP